MGFLNRRVWLSIIAALLFAPSQAHAHAHLLRSEPADKARLEVAPSALRLSFSERPELSLTFAELKDSQGKAYVTGPATRSQNNKLGVEFSISDSLGPGRYTLSWRTAAADGHPSHGELSFEILPKAAVNSTPTATANTDSVSSAALRMPVESANHVSDDDHAASIPNSLARTLLFIGLLVLIGVVTFALVVLPNATDVTAVSKATMLARAARAGMTAATVIAIAAVLRLYLEASMMKAMPAMPGMVGMTTRDMVIDTGWGFALLLQLASAVVAFIAFAMASRKTVWAWYLATLCAVALAVTPALSGHAAASPNFTALVVISDWLHVLAGGAWLGTLLCVMAIGVPVACMCAGDERWACVSSLVRMFSRIAMLSVAVIVISGVFASWIHLTSLSDLWTTSYGKTLLAKVALAAFALSAGAFNLKRVQPHLRTENGTNSLRKSATAELVAGFLVLIVTGFLTGLSP